MAEEDVFASEEIEDVYSPQDIINYRPIALAPEFLEKGDTGALEKIITDVYKRFNVKKTLIEDSVSSLIASPQSLQTFIKNSLGRYKEARESQKINDLRPLYYDLFEKFYEEEIVPKMNKVFDSDETYGSVREKYEVAQKIISTKSEDLEKQREQAKKDLERLSKIVEPIEEFEKRQLDIIRKPIYDEYLKKEDESLKKRLNSAYREKPKEKTEYINNFKNYINGLPEEERERIIDNFRK